MPHLFFISFIKTSVAGVSIYTFASYKKFKSLSKSCRLRRIFLFYVLSLFNHSAYHSCFDFRILYEEHSKRDGWVDCRLYNLYKILFCNITNIFNNTFYTISLIIARSPQLRHTTRVPKREGTSSIITIKELEVSSGRLFRFVTRSTG